MNGYCECRSVTLQIDGDIHDFSHCHYSHFRRLHGAAYATFASVTRNHFATLQAKRPSNPMHQQKVIIEFSSANMAPILWSNLMMIQMITTLA
jgi:hypothetical protein